MIEMGIKAMANRATGVCTPSRSGTVQVRNTIATESSSHSIWRRIRSSPRM